MCLRRHCRFIAFELRYRRFQGSGWARESRSICRRRVVGNLVPDAVRCRGWGMECGVGWEVCFRNSISGMRECWNAGMPSTAELIAQTVAEVIGEFLTRPAGFKFPQEVCFNHRFLVAPIDLSPHIPAWRLTGFGHFECAWLGSETLRLPTPGFVWGGRRRIVGFRG